MAKNIVLIGLMGSGKTTVGELLAQKLNRKLIDIDSLIEQEAGKSISDIFKLYGEALFRKLETKMVNKLSNEANAVISTGGGVVENKANIDSLKKNGVLVYLYANPKELYNRVKDDTNRPLLKNAKPLSTLKSLLLRREEFYNLADFKVDTTGKKPYEIADEIIENYTKYEN